MKYDLEHYIPFHFVDAAGILFFGRAGEIFHQTYEKWLLQKNSNWDSIFKNKDFAIPIKNFQVEYMKPVLAGKTYIGSLCITRIGTSSFESQFELRSAKDLHFRTTATHVWIALPEMKASPIPELWKDYFSQYLESI